MTNDLPRNDLPRVAVLGVPRGFTSVTVGMLRILGFEVPDRDRDCLHGEARGLVAGAYMELEELGLHIEQVESLPPGSVWKDPTVGDYVQAMDLRDWVTITVTRDPEDVAASELRHCADWSEPDRGFLVERATRWQEEIDRSRLKWGGWSIPGEQVVERPDTMLHVIARAVGVPVTPMHEKQAWRFVRFKMYMCPLPVTCFEHGRSKA